MSIVTTIFFSVKKNRHTLEELRRGVPVCGAGWLSRADYPIPNSTSTTPYTTLAAMPNTMTGPAMVKILAAVPVT